MPRLLIDGASHTGTYLVECQTCGDSWTGQAEQIGAVNYSPAMPMAEGVVHAKLGHSETQIDVVFTERFRLWLLSYWERASLRIAQKSEEARRDAAVREARLGHSSWTQRS